METGNLKKFAQWARRYLREQVSSKLEHILATDSAETRESYAVKELKDEITKHGKEQVIEKVAYLWFNRFCALRFMDANGYNRTAIVSPAEGMTLPEILQEAKSGHVDDELFIDHSKLSFLLTEAKQDEAYRMLLVAACNQQNKLMPFMFEKIADYTELLMPSDLLSENSILNETRETLTAEVCADVEVIGWLYQFYISEKKDEVFADLKKNKKITPENIPAATQLFTPNWIVRYLVENSLGRLWMLNKPNSRLVDQMEYYIKPEVVGSGQTVVGSEENANNQEKDFLKVSSPIELKVCDPACGSGHMLVYAFELLYTIYEEEGYDAPEISGLILKNNLFGIELDERAGELAAFALTMKARSKYRRFFRKTVQPNICVLESVKFEDEELENYMEFIGHDLFSTPLLTTLKQFKDADNFGSLISPIETNIARVNNYLSGKDIEGNLFMAKPHKKVLKILNMVEYLSPRYQVVVANPPYMGGKGMNAELSDFAKKIYPDSKSDLFAMFIERGFELVPAMGYSAMVTMQSWMFLSSYEKLRSKLLSETTIDCMVHMGNMVMGIAFGTSATVWKKDFKLDCKGSFSFVDYKDLNDIGIPKEFPIPNERLTTASAKDFGKIPGSPIAYWVSKNVRRVFNESVPLIEATDIKQGLATCNNDLFLRQWFEVPLAKIGFGVLNTNGAYSTNSKWFPYNKGGGYRKWYGNNENVVNWENNGKEIHEYSNLPMGYSGAPVRAKKFYFQEGMTYGLISSYGFSSRRVFGGFIFDVGGSMIFPNSIDTNILQCFLCSKLISEFLTILNPTLNYQVGDIQKLPIHFSNDFSARFDFLAPISKTKCDWDSYETSWDFESHPLLTVANWQTEEDSQGTQSTNNYLQPTKSCLLSTACQELRKQWKESTLEMQCLEEENNRIFIDAYGLQDELTPDVPLKEITLTCNPYYRYGKVVDSEQKVIGSKGNMEGREFPFDEELEGRLLQDTMKEFISYAVGCMFGRYSLDKPGLIIANTGETLEDYFKSIGSWQQVDGSTNEEKTKNCILRTSFCPDDDNAIPLMSVDWFDDDIVERFKQFLKVTFGEENYEENLRFIEDALGYKAGGKSKPLAIRDYFLKNFYADHVQRYKKRPIYWMFSSPKGTFNVIIYMHRYSTDTISIVLNEYLREFSKKLTAHRNNKQQELLSAEGKQQIALAKEIAILEKQIEEIDDYERDLYQLASKPREELEIDLDDGVKVNYPKFGSVFKKIAGVS